MSGPLRIYTTAQVCKALGVSKSTLTKWVRERKVPALQLPGGHYRFDITEVKRALDRDTKDFTVIADATDDQLFDELTKRWKRREAKSMVRTVAMEARHQLHVASSRMLTIRDEIGKGYDKPEHIEFEVREVIAQMQALIDYTKTGRGGTSYLGDRNAR